MSQRATNGGTCCVPRRTAEKTEPCIGVAHAGSYENIAPPKRRTDSIQTAKNIGFEVEIFAGSHVPAPAAIHEGYRWVRSIRSAQFDFPQIVECFQYRLSRRCCIETNRLEQMRQEPTDPGIASGQFPVVHVFWWANDGVHLAHRRLQLLAFQRLEDCGSQFGVQ